MPAVPRYTAPQQDLNPLQAPQITPSTQGTQLQKLGGALQGAGADLNAIQAQIQERENGDSVMRAETALKDDLIKYEQETRQNRQGRFAKDLTKDTERWWEERMQKHTQSLGNDVQRQIFGRRANGLRNQAIRSVSTWESNQLEKSHDEGWVANKNVTISAATANATPETVGAARLELQTLNQYQARRKGWSPAQLQAEQLKDTTKLHTEVIQGLVRADPIAAKAYFEANKGEIDGTRHAELSAFAEKVTATALGDQAATLAWNDIGPKSDTQPVELDKLEARIRSELKGNEPAIKEAIRSLRERVSAHKDSRRERGEAQESAVNTMILNGASFGQVRRSPEFMALPPEQARKIAEHMERQESARAGRAAAYSQRADAEESRAERRRTREGTDTALRLSDPQALAALTRDQVVNLLPELGAQHTSELVRKWDSYKKNPQGLVEATIDKQDFDAAVLAAGLNPTPKSSDTDERHALIRLQSHVEQVIDQEQRAKGSKLSREDKAKIVNRELDKKVIVEGRLWGRSEVPAPMVAPEQLKRAVVEVNGKEFKLSSIPDNDMEQLIAAARRKGITATPQLIAEKYADLLALRRSQGK